MDFGPWLEFVLERQEVLWLRTGEHLMLAGLSTVVATISGVSLGVLGFKFQKLKGLLLLDFRIGSLVKFQRPTRMPRCA